MLKKFLLPTALILLIATINVFRCSSLERVPDGFMFDEEAAAVSLQCLIENGTAPLSNQKYPLFADVGIASPLPPTYLYPGVVWVNFFGFSEASMRGLIVFSFLVGLMGLFAIGWHVAGYPCALWILLAGSLSPWTWTYTRMGWAPTFILPYLIWGLFVCLRAKHFGHFILAGVLISCAIYSYPTAKLQIPLLLITLAVYGIKRLNWKISHVLTLGAAVLITTIPLIHLEMTNDSSTVRLGQVIITNPEYLKSVGKTNSIPDIISVLFDNTMSQLSPDYLFFKGVPKDTGMSTGRQGILSWLDGIALIICLFWSLMAWRRNKFLPEQEDRAWIEFVGLNIIIGMLPAFVCNINNPLHSIGAWPFVMIATGMIIHKTTERWDWGWLPPFLASAVFAGVFLYQYFTYYPKDSVWIFRKWSQVEATQAKTQEDWMKFLFRHREDKFASRYFLMRYRGDNCQEAKATWEKLNPVFENMAEQMKHKKPQP